MKWMPSRKPSTRARMVTSVEPMVSPIRSSGMLTSRAATVTNGTSSTAAAGGALLSQPLSSVCTRAKVMPRNRSECFVFAMMSSVNVRLGHTNDAQTNHGALMNLVSPE
ncbi:hypothetical protein D3C72_1963030 [compost metagenome]